MAAILFNGAKLFDQIVNNLLPEDPMWNRIKIAQEVSEKTFKNFTILYMYIVQGKGQVAPKI